MINSKGVVQNNKCVGEFLKNLKSLKTQYKTLNKKEERELIEKYVSMGKEEELRKLLVMHNIRFVFSIAKKHCKDTRDFDNNLAHGLYGLVYASNRFNLFEPIKVNVLVGEEKIVDDYGKAIIDEESGLPKVRPIYVQKEKIDPITKKPEYIKFCTYAKNWIFKYVMEEFGKRSIIIDNNSISLDDKIKIKNSYDNKQTFENYVNEMISQDVECTRTTLNEISEDDINELYGKIGDYIRETNELTALEKQIVIDTYYNHKKINDIAFEIGINAQKIVNKKNSGLKKLKKFLKNSMNLESMSDILV